MAGLANTDYLLNKNKWHNHSAASVARNYKYKKKAGNGAHPYGTSAWFLPSVGQWDKMVIAAGGCKNLQNNTSLDTYDGYHSSTEIHNYQAWCFRLYNGVYILRTAKSSTGVRVRPALAF